MAKAKNKINVKTMSVEQLLAAKERVSGTQKTKLINELTRRGV